MVRQANYLRVSTVGQEENYSLPEQERDCTAFAERTGNTIVGTYNEGAGKSYTLQRDELTKLTRDAAAGKFDIVCVGKYDRLSRNQIQLAVIHYQLEQYGVKLVSATEPLPDGIIGTFIRNSIAFAAEWELFKIRERTSNGRKSRARAGKIIPTGNPLYGYKWTNPNERHGKDGYEEDPEAANVVRLIFQLVLSGRTIRSVGRELDERGILSPGKTAWRVSTLSRILANPAYTGKYTAWRNDKDNQIPLPASACPALVDEATFNAVQEILDRHKVQSSRNSRDPEAVLLRNGYAVCGHCGRAMAAHFAKSNQRYRYYCGSQYDPQPGKCPNRYASVISDHLDAIVWNWVLAAFSDPEIIREAFERWKGGQNEGMSVEYDRLNNMPAMIENAERRWKNCMESAAEARSAETRAHFTKLADEAQEEAAKLRDERDQLDRILGTKTAEVAQVESLVLAGQQAMDKLQTADFADKRTILHALGIKIYVKSLQDWRIEWRLAYTPQTVKQGTFVFPPAR
jgi:site-specific DNA recombinase